MIFFSASLRSFGGFEGDARTERENSARIRHYGARTLWDFLLAVIFFSASLCSFGGFEGARTLWDFSLAVMIFFSASLCSFGGFEGARTVWGFSLAVPFPTSELFVVSLSCFEVDAAKEAIV